jgi:hypothetical protein
MCAELARFENAPYAQGERARWVELHWVGEWLSAEGWDVSCRSSGDEAGDRFCGWLLQNTSYEWGQITPNEMLGCHGYRFPRPIHE